MRGHSSPHSLATGPVMIDPFISPLFVTMTPALSSKYTNDPSSLRHGFRCLITTACITFFLSSGLPFFTLHRIMSPTVAAGRRLRRPLYRVTAIVNKFFAPTLILLSTSIICTVDEGAYGKTKGHL
eukprot:TRINITY_DN644_c0_g1_i8.p1 TRINITY_DN644_c0_g1~~TRINITY_DN644_c0_g1_i8.p1  ORF type:complete len:126 (-),score=1.16 TRINITY_DN644_c0_g1_i8:244-621(-)